MTAVKEVYHESGMTLSDKHEELPDHLGVELEFLQYLSFRESESLQDKEEEIVKFCSRYMPSYHYYMDNLLTQDFFPGDS